MSPTQPHVSWESWSRENPHVISLCSGAIAGAVSETLLFPLDSLKTRLQSRRGFVASGGFVGIYRGVFTAIAAAAPASAIFFSTYEGTQRSLRPYDTSHSVLAYCGIGMIASIAGELAAGVWRVPVDLVKQRQQSGGNQSLLEVMKGVRSTQRSIFLASYQASFMRDIMHSGLQFPMYEYLKLVCASSQGMPREQLPTWQAATCGSCAGVVSAALSTPLDLLRTRLNLRDGDQACRISPHALLKEEIENVYRTHGVVGFFAGGACRAAWMGLGGFIFLGSFELAKKHLFTAPIEEGFPTAEAASGALAFTFAGKDVAHDSGYVKKAAEHLHNEAMTRQLGSEPPAAVSFSAGLLAGVAVDVPLHPVDTLKTRLQSTEGFWELGGTRNLWNGLSAVFIVSLPGSALFFLMYESVRHFLERQMPQSQQEKHFSIFRDAVAASVADVSACVVRVPCEVLKQRMQATGLNSAPPTFLNTVASVSTEGVSGFFAGFGATAMREVPFALIQMPLFEEMKHHHPWAAQANQDGNTQRLGLIGMHCGCFAGSLAGFVTTPLDLAKTQIMLTENPKLRLGVFSTMRAIWNDNGIRGLFRGATPRTIHSGLGGALWLGAFEWSKLLLWNIHL